MLIVKALNTKAVTKTEGQKQTYLHDVVLELEQHSSGLSLQPDGNLGKKITNKWILKIKGTPAQWYMSTLLEGPSPASDTIYIDYGQAWICSNFRQVMKEALELI